MGRTRKEISGYEVTSGIAMACDVKEYEYQNALYIHKLNDEFRDGDIVVFCYEMPEDLSDLADIFRDNDYWTTDYKTLKSFVEDWEKVTIDNIPDDAYVALVDALAKWLKYNLKYNLLSKEIKETKEISLDDLIAYMKSKSDEIEMFSINIFSELDDDGIETVCKSILKKIHGDV